MRTLTIKKIDLTATQYSSRQYQLISLLQKLGTHKFRTEIWNMFAGDRLKQKRQEVIFELTGVKQPLAKCGVSAIEQETLKLSETHYIPTLREQIGASIKRKFRHLSNQQLVERINSLPDFGWDDEGCELQWRREDSNGKFITQMDGNTLIILKDEK